MDDSQETQPQFIGIATYSFEDDKLRFYPDSPRLPLEIYKCFKAAGFIHAPVQRLYVQVWNPEREDLLLELAGDIEDEATPLEERTQARAERFKIYSEHAEERAEDEQARVEKIAGGIPLGQPILVGHHSEKKARRDAERIENGIRRAVEEYRRAEYWQGRAKRAVQHAKRRERPDVIFRRIKTLEAELRKYERLADPKNPEWVTRCVWMAHDGKTAEEIRAAWEAREGHAKRWISHLVGRLTYERELYQASGGVPADQKPLEVGGAVYVYGRWREILKVNWHKGQVKSVSVPSGYTWNDKITTDKIGAIKTREEYAAYLGGCVTEEDVRIAGANPSRAHEPAKWEELAGTTVQAVGGIPDFYPTPPELVKKMLDAACLEPSLFVLEPSAGKGDIADQLRLKGCAVTCVEINPALCVILAKKRHNVVPGDFLAFWEGKYNRVVMNPPFSDEQDIEHVWHAYELLLEGGILVAIMSEHAFFADTLRAREFRAWFGQVGDESEQLPEDAFAASGAHVCTRMVVIQK